MIPAPRVSVVIATYNRAALLDECLQHLLRQPFADGDEIIVVDNGSTDHTRRVVQRHQAAAGVPLHLLNEPTPGKSHAIAQAVRVATGDVLAFTDDDVNVGPQWLVAIRQAMADPRVGVAGGPVNPRWQQTVPRWIRRARERHPRLGAPIALLDYGDQPVEIGQRTLLGANLAARRDAFLEVGGYPTRLGKLRGTLLSGEDHELCRRIGSTGRLAMYLPAAAVEHWVPADRARVGYFLRWFYWSGITHAIMDADTEPNSERSGRNILGVPLYIARRAGLASARLAGSLVSAQWTRALDAALDVAFSAGYTAARWGLSGQARAKRPATAKEAA